MFLKRKAVVIYMLYPKLVLFSLVLVITISLANASISYNVDAPKEIQVGKWFNVSVSVSSNESTNLTIYSYVYQGLNVVSQGWTANKKEIILEPNDEVNLTLEDLVKYNTEDGIYNLRVRFKYSDQTINETFQVKVYHEAKIFEENYLYFILIIASVIGLGLIFLSRR